MKFPYIEAERIKHQMSKDELANLLEVSRRTVQNYQNGSTEIPVSKLVRLSEAWGVSINYLLGLDTNQSA